MDLSVEARAASEILHSGLSIGDRFGLTLVVALAPASELNRTSPQHVFEKVRHFGHWHVSLLPPHRKQKETCA